MAVSTPAKLVSPGYVINGTMSVTKSELYFEMDDDDEENKKIDPKVRHSRKLFYRLFGELTNSAYKL